jgi:RNA polymerase sigma-70 factor (ECF subfamily)
MSVVDVPLHPGIEEHRRELTGYCYRMLGSGAEAEDAVQETIVRAWRGIERLEDEGALRSWLYRIATNICLDMLKSAQRRARPMDLGPASTAAATLGPEVPEHLWLQPVADDRVIDLSGDPGEIAAARESIRLAFVAALQHLPARQRVVLILRDVLRWQAAEVAELLESTVASVNSALQRARATLAERDLSGVRVDPIDDEQRALLDRYVDAFERYDIPAFVSLLHEDAVQSMPPYELWLEGRDELGKWMLGTGIGCKDARLLPTWANGCPAYGNYRVGPDGRHTPFSIQILHIQEGRVAAVHHFLYPELFPAFGLPMDLD